MPMMPNGGFLKWGYTQTIHVWVSPFTGNPHMIWHDRLDHEQWLSTHREHWGLGQKSKPTYKPQLLSAIPSQVALNCGQLGSWRAEHQNMCMFLWFRNQKIIQWKFQDPKMEVPTINGGTYHWIMGIWTDATKTTSQHNFVLGIWADGVHKHKATKFQVFHWTCFPRAAQPALFQVWSPQYWPTWVANQICWPLQRISPWEYQAQPLSPVPRNFFKRKKSRNPADFHWLPADFHGFG